MAGSRSIFPARQTSGVFRPGSVVIWGPSHGRRSGARCARPGLARPRRGRTPARACLVAGVGEVTWDRLAAPCAPMGTRGTAATGPLKVVDTSSLWAGPLCGSILADSGAQVAKIESWSRPDTARLAAPAFYERLNRRKTEKSLDFDSCEDREWLLGQILDADVLITGARRRAFDNLGLAPEVVFAANPQLVWVAITGYGFLGESADRVAFGDDAAAAGGLVKWTPAGAPNFVGDALADPLTGLAAAVGALLALKGGGGCLVDAAMAEISAGAARAAMRELHT